MTFEIDVRDLLRRPGSSRTLEIEQAIEGLRTQLAHVPEDRPLGARLLVESVVEGVLASGPLTGVMVVHCARCLAPSESEFTLEVQELFAPGATPDDEAYPLVEGFLDLEPMIRDAVLLSMPLAPLCRPDCLGLCGRCGGDRNVGECSCPPEVDPRWSPLIGLRLEEASEHIDLGPGPAKRR
jgi:uncharacterized protein